MIDCSMADKYNSNHSNHLSITAASHSMPLFKEKKVKGLPNILNTSTVPALRAGIIHNDKQTHTIAKVLHTYEHCSFCDQYIACKQ